MKGLISSEKLKFEGHWKQPKYLTYVTYVICNEDKFEFLSHAVNRSNSLNHLPFTCEVYQYSTSKGNLTPVQQLRDLGVTVSSDLSWTLHIKAMANKARQKTAWVLSVFHTRSSTIMLHYHADTIQVHGTQFTRILLPIMESIWSVRYTRTGRSSTDIHISTQWQKFKKWLGIQSGKKKRL